MNLRLRNWFLFKALLSAYALITILLLLSTLALLRYDNNYCFLMLAELVILTYVVCLVDLIVLFIEEF